MLAAFDKEHTITGIPRPDKGSARKIAVNTSQNSRNNQLDKEQHPVSARKSNHDKKLKPIEDEVKNHNSLGFAKAKNQSNYQVGAAAGNSNVGQNQTTLSK